jgi:hypothetical protein
MENRNNTTSKIVNLDDGKPPSNSALVSTTVYLQPVDSSTPIEISEEVLSVTNPPFLGHAVAPVGDLSVAAAGEGLRDRWIIDPG